MQQPSTIAPEETDSAQPDSIEDVPALVPPTTEVHRSFLDAMAEFAAEGRGRDDDKTMIGWEILAYRNRWDTPAGFADFIADLLAEADENTPRPPGIVPCTTLWWVEGHAYLGRLAIRHRLTPQLSEVGGHIGYDVRPSARNQGHGTAMLSAALPIARSLGITSALLTCDTDNLASRRIIERHGGVRQDERNGKYRYLVPTEAAGLDQPAAR